MKQRSILYIAYGSNMNLSQMAWRCPTAKMIGTSEIKDYELQFRGKRLGAVATIEPSKGSTVPVLLWELQQEDEKALDLYEGYPRLYQKQKMEVVFQGTMVSAMVYVMTPGYEFGIPSDAYLDGIRQGYREAGLNTQTLENALEQTLERLQQGNQVHDKHWWREGKERSEGICQHRL